MVKSIFLAPRVKIPERAKMADTITDTEKDQRSYNSRKGRPKIIHFIREKDNRVALDVK